jgi:predicted metalloprotease with PDZ domain
VAPGRSLRSAEDMSRMAPFVDGGTTVDRTNWSTSYISYYWYGGAIALALDLTLRHQTDSAVTLDHFMQAMWRVHGKPGGVLEGFVDHPYSPDDVEARLAEVSGDPAFAHDFFSRYIRGREAPDYTALLAHAGFVVRKRNPGRAWWGDLRLEPRGGQLTIAGLVAINSPAYAAGLEQDDELHSVEATRIRSAEDLSAALQRVKPGDAVRVGYSDRTGMEKTTTVTFAEDPHLEVLPVEAAEGSVTSAQRAFRSRWLTGS